MEEVFSYWPLIEDAYDQVVLDTPAQFAEDLARYPEWIGDLVAAHWLGSEVDNGGFAQLFDNPTGVVAPRAHVALVRIGMPGLADVLARAMSHISDGYDPDRYVRQSRLLKLVQDQHDLDAIYSEGVFEDFDDEFFGSSEHADYWDRLNRHASRQIE